MVAHVTPCARLRERWERIDARRFCELLHLLPGWVPLWRGLVGSVFG
ncbi:hypothetical protein GCM10009678_01030 [Actinomadura kijaniata]|uniref:Uncharacterized protein n=1 Tax=Actinomadura namibiensis TaxID=182080 RepID=A0A7W3QNA4_ACTNM|nr:hypothetical protein [Actinomadura namibiensis]MBA8953369.1 hypothetical protein [Actinomadura namibiensis]